MRVIICDRCKKRINDDKVGVICVETRGIKGTVIAGSPFKDWDFCPSCMADIMEYIIPDEEVEEKPKPKAVVRMASGMTPKTSPEQIARIKQMVKDGKAVKEIVEAVGVSDPTVRKYKKEAEAENDAIHEGDEG